MLTPMLFCNATFGGDVALQGEILFEPQPRFKPNNKIRALHRAIPLFEGAFIKIRGPAFLRLKNCRCL